MKHGLFVNIYSPVTLSFVLLGVKSNPINKQHFNCRFLERYFMTYIFIVVDLLFFFSLIFFFINIKKAEHMLQKEPNRESFVVVLMKKVIC